MTALVAVARRELELLFRSPLAWVTITVFHLFNGLAWRNLVTSWQADVRAAAARGGIPADAFADAVLSPYFVGLAFALILFLPFLTMRTFAEERRSGFEDLLFSLPLPLPALVGGKLAAALLTLALLVAPAGLLPIFAAGVAPIEPGVVAAGLLGAALVGLAVVALGTWVSSLGESQPVAAAVTLGALLGLFLADRFWEPAAAVSLRIAQEPFGRGVLSLRGAVLLLSLAGGALLLTVRGLEDRRRAG
jgi:ABC-2 type transport system permease protein